jgi:predicted regulator of Ras-like GTPase activity (Roadblock/LC7/MglB family)
VADGANTKIPVSGEKAERALDLLAELSPDLRGAAILDREGATLAATADPARWAEDGVALLAVADGAGGEPAEQVHIATERGEVFVVRHGGLAALAVTERFALSSVLFYDMRAILRDLAAEGVPA